MSPVKTDVLSLLTAFPLPCRQLWWFAVFPAGVAGPFLNDSEWPHPLPLGPTPGTWSSGDTEKPEQRGPRLPTQLSKASTLVKRAVLLLNLLRQVGYPDMGGGGDCCRLAV